ncbi:MAG: hypothetical protein ACREB3_18225, partial [Burkholderiales bacterium]
MDPSFEKEILDHLKKLPTEKQRLVLTFLRGLTHPRPKGTPGKDLLRFAGAIAATDLREMSAAIEEACER